MSESGSSQNSLQLTLSPSIQISEASPQKSKKHARFSVANVSDDNNSRKNSDISVPELPNESETHQKSHQKSHHSHHSGSGTYNTWYFKSLRHYLTRDVLPAEHNYRNLLSLARQNPEQARKYSRPTLDELHDENGELNQKLLKAAERNPKVSLFHTMNFISHFFIPRKKSEFSFLILCKKYFLL